MQHALQAWLAANGAPEPILAIAEFDDTGRGMAALRDIEAGEAIMTIPRKLMITRSLVLEMVPPALRPQLAGQSEHAVLVIFVYLLASNSPLFPAAIHEHWRPYVRSLPESFDALYFSPVMHEHPMVPQETQALVAHQKELIAQHTLLLESVLAGSAPVDRARFEWAWFVVNTRCVSFPTAMAKSASSAHLDTQALAPLLDMLNHAPDVSVTVRENVTLADGSGPHYSLVTTRAWRRGEQVFIHYGDHDNWKLLAEYGFAIPRNTHTVSVQPLLERAFSPDNETYAWCWDAFYELGLASPAVMSLPADFGLRAMLKLLLQPLAVLGRGRASKEFQRWQGLYYSGSEADVADEGQWVAKWIDKAAAAIRGKLHEWRAVADGNSAIAVILDDYEAILE
ncbi:hypothetical protein H9P43_006341 [Blastocladiella emersonii ATCC 22665]|nr:hypothetical protein H9P43_006341 [Blastocladiella emersonii ATCC 22665]